MDQEIHRIWILVTDLSEQLIQNNKVAAELRAQIETLKEQADETSKGLTLRRYNTDISKELFESELERTTVAVILENQGLLQESKQLAGLLREYEETLDTVMNKFKAHAHVAAQHEITLTGHYEALLTAQEGQPSSQTYDLFTLGAALERLQGLIRLSIKAEAGGDLDAAEEEEANLLYRKDSATNQESDLEKLALALEDMEAEDSPVDWGVEREAEIARLEQENEELRKILGVSDDLDDFTSGERPASPSISQRHSREYSSSFGVGFTASPTMTPNHTSNPSSFAPSFSTMTSQLGGYTPPAPFSHPDRIFSLPHRAGAMGPAPPPRNAFAESSMAGRQQPTLASFYRGPIAPRDRLDLASGQETLL